MFKKIERLLTQGADPNSRDRTGATPLFYFLSNICEKDLKQLKEYESESDYWDPHEEKYNRFEEPHYRDENDFTPLHYQCQYHSFLMIGYKESLRTLKLLLKHGGDINLPNCRPLIKGIGLCSAWDDGWFIDFLLEYSDLIEITESSSHEKERRCIDLLSLDNYDDVGFEQSYVWKACIAHIAKLEFIGVVSAADSNIFYTIDEYEIFTEYLDECREELKELTDKKIANNSWKTCYDLLLDSRRKLKNYVGNEAVNADRANEWEKEFPIYGFTIQKKVLSAIARRKLLEESARVLSECLPIFNPMHLVIRDTLDCIKSKKDLSKFIKVENVRKRKLSYTE